MTTFKALTQFTLDNRLVSEISELDGDKFMVNNGWGDFRSWFYDNKNVIWNYRKPGAISDINFGMFFRSDEIIQDLKTIMNLDYEAYISSPDENLGKVKLSRLGGKYNKLWTSVPGFDAECEGRFNEVWDAIRNGKEVCRDDWSFSPKAFKFMKKYLGNVRIKFKAIVGNYYSYSFIKSELDKGTVKLGTDVEYADAPVKDFIEKELKWENIFWTKSPDDINGWWKDQVKPTWESEFRNPYGDLLKPNLLQIKTAITQLEGIKQKYQAVDDYWISHLKLAFNEKSLYPDGLKEIKTRLEQIHGEYKKVAEYWKEIGFDKRFGERINKESLDKIKLELDGLKTANDKLTTDLSTTNQDKQKLTDQITTLTNDKATAEKDRDQLKSDKEKLTTDLKDKDVVITSKDNELSQKNQEIQSKDKNITDLTTDIKNRDTTISDLNHSLKDKQKIIDDTKDLPEQVAGLQKQLTDKDLELGKRNDAITTLTTERDTAINELNPVKEYWDKNLKERLKGEKISVESLTKIKKVYEGLDRIETNLKELDQAWIDNNLVEFGGDLDIEALKGVRKELDRLKTNKAKVENQSTQYLNKLLEIYKKEITQATQAFYLNDLGLDESDNINPKYWGKDNKDKSYLEKLNELNGDSDPEQVIIAFKWVALISATEKAQEISNKWIKSPLAKKLKEGKLKQFESVKKYWDILKEVEPKAENNPLYLKNVIDKDNRDFWKNNLKETIKTWQALN